MRAILASLTTAFAFCTGMATCDMPTTQPKSEMTVQDINRQIDMIKEQIAKYNNLATDFDRKSSDLQSHDFSGARHAASVRDEIRTLAKDLQKHLVEMEKTRDDMIKQGR